MSGTARVALVTGASRGIGLELCRQLHSRGHQVVLGSRDLAKGEAAALRIGPRVHAVALDVTDPEAPHRAAEEISRQFGRLDILVNNAAIHYDTWQRPSTADRQVIREAFDTNVFGAWAMAQAVVPMMRAQRWGRIINVSSEAGSLHSMGASAPAYSASKSALNAITRLLAADLRGAGILVNSVCPGWVATDMGGQGGRPVEQGAASVLWAVELPDSGPTGGFFRDGRPLPW